MQERLKNNFALAAAWLLLLAAMVAAVILAHTGAVGSANPVEYLFL